LVSCTEIKYSSDAVCTLIFRGELLWTLDVAFREYPSRKRASNSARNFSTLLKIPLNLLKTETSLKQDIKEKRLKARWDVEYLLKVLSF
jgi:hypothetical protein|tara:strand:- start:652 stop:918 length:267 start_codon:yes stop_codon:yes gene_type:complete